MKEKCEPERALTMNSLTVAVLDPTSKVPFPQITHEGKKYVMSQPGAEYVVTATCTNPRGKLLFVNLTIDGALVQVAFTPSKPKQMCTFEGYPVGVGFGEYTRFKFADAELDDGSGGAAAVNKSFSDIVGTINVTVSNAVKTNIPTVLRNHTAPSDAKKIANKKKGKFFELPSLTTGVGSKFVTVQKAAKFQTRKTDLVTSTIIQCETLETLRLRKIPIPAAMVTAYFAQTVPVIQNDDVKPDVSLSSSSSSSSSSSTSSSKRKRASANGEAKTDDSSLKKAKNNDVIDLT